MLHPSYTVVADHLASDGVCVCPDFLPAEQIAALAQDACQRLAAFQPAGTGARHTHSPQVRGDSTLWLEPPGESDSQRQVLTQFETLRLALNRELQLGLFDFECHYALYPPDTGYERHRDRFTGDRRRVLSCVLYLNQDWHPDAGGCLRMYRSDTAPLDVLPQGGTLVLFLSERFEHAVLPARRERLSLAGWFRQRTA